MSSMKEIFKGDKDGSPVNGPSTSGANQGAGAVTRLKTDENGGRTTLSDNPGSGPYGGGGDYGSTLQDKRGDADLYDEPSNNGGNDEHQESAADKDVGDYYAELSKRRAPNYDKNANLQTKQAPYDLPPADGGEGFVGSNTGPAVNFNYIAGKKGFSKDMDIWSVESSFSNGYPDNTGSTVNTNPNMGDPGIIPSTEDSRDEFAPWKLTQGDEGLPQTAYTDITNGGTPIKDSEPDANGILGQKDGGGNPDTQDFPSSVESGNRDFSSLPQTEFTTTNSNDGGGAPRFKFAGVDEGEKVYSVRNARKNPDQGTNPDATPAS